MAGCSKCKKKIIDSLPIPVNESIENNLPLLNRMDFIFNAKNSLPYLLELKELWRLVFKTELVFDIPTAKRVFYNYLSNNNIKL